ncbi:DUF1622 domain-containing protein [Kitasatospora sp. NPDC059571]|uniref:DUF1622 domain-containing protein n=1 Tax=Kitasatospora sp. NPDC059571 TaxID=3346871 RepID=UPI0036CCCB1C
MSAESALEDALGVIVPVVEACGAVVIAFGAVFSFIRLITLTLRGAGSESFVSVRLGLGTYLALGLEFQLASDVLRTAVSPTFEQIGQLAAIAAIRTALNYFLSREIAEERRQVAAQSTGPRELEKRAARHTGYPQEGGPRRQPPAGTEGDGRQEPPASR